MAYGRSWNGEKKSHMRFQSVLRIQIDENVLILQYNYIVWWSQSLLELYQTGTNVQSFYGYMAMWKTFLSKPKASLVDPAPLATTSGPKSQSCLCTCCWASYLLGSIAGEGRETKADVSIHSLCYFCLSLYYIYNFMVFYF